MHRFWLGLLLIIVIAGSYYSSFPGAFHYDDYPLLLENPKVIESDFDYSSFLYQYGGRPLTLWVFHVNHRLAGPSPSGFHAVNMGLHVLVVLLLFVLVAKWTGQMAVGFLTALLFAIHPAQVQAVNYIWSRSVLLMSVFVLLALITRRPWLRLTFFQLAIWSRAEALVALVPLIWRNPKRWKGVALLVSVNLACFGLGFLLDNPAKVGWNHPDILTYWLTAAQAFWMYGYLSLLPAKFSLYHSVLQFGWQSLLALTILLAAGGITWAIHKRWPWLAKGIIWFALYLAPGLLVPNAAQFHESRLYLALAGLCLLAAWGLTKLDPHSIAAGPDQIGTLEDSANPAVKAIRVSRQQRVIRLLPAVLLIGTFVVTTHNRNNIWLSETELWKEAVQRYPTDFVPHYNLAVAYARQGERAAAESEFLTARDLNDSDDLAYAGLGYCAESRERWFEALAYYRSALLINPANGYASESLQRVREIIALEGLAP
jgi:tetratricopeptide (TPR) repeat protein